MVGNESKRCLEGKVALVTGSSQGIGRATVLALAHSGASVVVNYNREANAARQVVDSITRNGGQAIALQCDVTQTANIQSLFDGAREAFGGLDIVVSNAGTLTPPCSVAEVSEAEFDQGFSINGRSHFFVMQMAARTLRNNGRLIVMLSSITAIALAGFSVYAGAKAAAELYMRVLAKELAPKGITVNAVTPGLTDTPRLRSNHPQEQIDAIVRMTPLGRLGQPEDIANVITFLASEQAGWITGQNLRVGGGLV